MVRSEILNISRVYLRGMISFCAVFKWKELIIRW